MRLSRTHLISALALLTAAATPALAQQTVSIGSSINGELSQTDGRRGNGAFADVYTFAGRAGERVTIQLRSSAIDPLLTLAGPGGFSAENDDSDGLNSRLDVTLPANGQYSITASSFAADATGGYALSLSGGGAVSAGGGMTTGGASSLRPIGSGGGGQGTGNASAATPTGAVRVGQNISGELRAGDSQISSGELADIYTFEGRAGQGLDIALSSSAFDPYLMIRGPNGFQHDNDDDSAGGTINSRLVVNLPETGTYRIQATSFASGETGRYQLSVAEASGAALAQAQQSNERSSAPLVPGQTVSGALAQGDSTLQTGEFADSYRVLGQRGQRIAIDMRSAAFDAYLILRAPSGAQEDNDDGPSGRDARIETTLAEDGEYIVTATSYQTGESGAYDIAIAALDAGERVAESAAPGAGARLALGSPAQGRLDAADTALESGEYTEGWSFAGRRGQTVTFDLSSTDFDPYLMVVTPSGEQHDNDDIEAGVRDSRVVLRLTEDGAYRVIATSYGAGETGAYRLSATSGGTVTTPTPVAGGGRVFALMVGISDYAGTANNLSFTAEDATNLAATLRAKGVLAPESVVLTDAQATRGAVQAAFQRLAAQAGPNDLFLFFYSGHGSQTDELQNAAGEADLRNESIVLRDGEVSDDEMAQWYNTLRTRMAVIALDSCFSGGFARDVVNRPGVMGLFSSEEDLTSAVAGKFRAGGYLSHFLRTGLNGEADGDGDTAITAGELSTYLWRRFATEVENEEAVTMRGERNYQRLVVDRGGVKIDDVVLALN